MIVTIGLLTILMLSSCAESKEFAQEKIRVNCRQSVVTYGDAIECMIKLDEVQNQ